jgi:hypothetical protein
MMGGGAGHVFDMIARIKANEALRKKKSYFRNKQEFSKAMMSKRLVYEHCSEADLAEIRQKIIADRKQAATRAIISMLIAAGILLLLIIAAMALINLLRT